MSTNTFPRRSFYRGQIVRACEYTCDNIGNSLCPTGSKDGLLVLAAGKKLYSKVNIEEYIEKANDERGFWKWFAEIISSHPPLPNRISNVS